MLALIIVAVVAFGVGRLTAPAVIRVEGQDFEEVGKAAFEGGRAFGTREVLDRCLDLERRVMLAERCHEKALAETHMMRLERDRLLERMAEVASDGTMCLCGHDLSAHHFGDCTDCTCRVPRP